MKKVYITMVATGVAALMITGCKSPEPAPEPVVVEEEAPMLIVPGATVTEDGMIMFTAEGKSVAETTDALSVAKAEVAAKVVAKANLLEIVKGALVSSSAKVSNLMLVEQSAEQKVYGWLARTTVEIVEVEKPIAEKTNLPVDPVAEPKTQIVTAIATLTLSEEDFANFEPFVE